MSTDKAQAFFGQRDIDDAQQSQVTELKAAAESLYDQIDTLPAETGEAKRLKALAITHLETAVMFAVKAVSRQKEAP